MLRYNYRTHRAAAKRLLPVWLHRVNVLYEESGAFKVATVLADSDNTLQVEASHGKRAKIKSKDVLLRFPEPSAADLLAQAEALAGGIEAATQRYWTTMERHKLYVSEHGEDMPEVSNWRWTS